MDFAFTVVLIVILLIPGFIFRILFNLTENTIIDPHPFSKAAIQSIIYSFILHFLWILGAKFLGFTINFEILFKLLTMPEKIDSSSFDLYLSTPILLIFIYFFSLFLFSGVLAFLLRKLVFNFFLDWRFPALRFETPWFYFFNNPSFFLKNFDAILISFLMDTADGSFLYVGILDEYHINPDGKLDRLVMDMVFRRPLTSDFDLETKSTRKQFSPSTANIDDRYYPITADRFVAKYENIKNLTVTYVTLEKV